QSVEPVGEVEGVDAADDGERVESDVQPRGRGRGVARVDGPGGEARADDEVPEYPVASQETGGGVDLLAVEPAPLAGQRRQIVEEPECGGCERDGDEGERRRAAVAEQEDGREGGKEERGSPHGGRARLAQVAARSGVPHHLAPT